MTKTEFLAGKPFHIGISKNIYKYSEGGNDRGMIQVKTFRDFLYEANVDKIGSKKVFYFTYIMGKFVGGNIRFENLHEVNLIEE